MKKSFVLFGVILLIVLAILFLEQQNPQSDSSGSTSASLAVSQDISKAALYTSAHELAGIAGYILTARNFRILMCRS